MYIVCRMYQHFCTSLYIVELGPDICVWERLRNRQCNLLSIGPSIILQLGGGHPNTTSAEVPGFPIVPPGGIACTSIVAQDDRGNVFHGRNLDWNLPDSLRNLTVQVTVECRTLFYDVTPQL